MFGDSFLDMAEAMLGKWSTNDVLLNSNSIPELHHHQDNNKYLLSTSTGNSNDNGNGANGNCGNVEVAKCSTADNNNSCEDNKSNIRNSSTDKIKKKKLLKTTKTSSSTKNSIRKSVVIELPLPTPKRQRILGNYSAVDIVQALNRAMSVEERNDALQNAMGTFDHQDKNLHDSEIEAGADVALVKALIFLEFKVGFRTEGCIEDDTKPIILEMATVLKTLECVYRASSDAVGKSFSKVGSDLLRILLTLIGNEIKNPSRAKNKKYGIGEGEGALVLEEEEEKYKYVQDLILRKATKIIGHFARVGRATRPMACFPGFLTSILDLINMRPYSSIPSEARLSCLWAIANIACNTNNMAMMTSTQGLIDSLVTIINRRTDSSCDTVETIMEILRAKSIASRTILNLSWSPDNKIMLSKNKDLVGALCRLSLERQAPYKRSKTMQDVLIQARRHSLASLRNISAAPARYKKTMCKYNDGKLLDILTDVALHETDQHVVDLSFSTIHNLAINETAEAIVDRPALVLALKNILLEDSNKNNSSSEGEKTPSSSCPSVTCQHASATILVLERSITPDKPSYENLRELLDAINPSCPSECVRTSN